MRNFQILLKETEIRTYLHDQSVELFLLESTTSTNDYFKGLPANSNLQFCFAEHQTNGRGRFNRKWVAPFGANILMTCRVPAFMRKNNLGSLSLYVGLSILKALEEFGLEDLSCKWPNDILYRGIKLAGILIENAESTGLIIGIGLNVNMPEAILSQVDRPIISLEAILGSPLDRNKIAALLINHLAEALKQFNSQEFNLQHEWQKHDFLRDKTITLQTGEGPIQGIAQGINGAGHLLVKLPSGEVKEYSAGEASLSAFDPTRHSAV